MYYGVSHLCATTDNRMKSLDNNMITRSDNKKVFVPLVILGK